MKFYSSHTSTEELPIRFGDIRGGYYELLDRWDWEAHITISFSYNVTAGTAFKHCKRFLKEVGKTKFKRIRFAGILIYSNGVGDGGHVHILVVSDRQYPLTFTAVDWDSLRSPVKRAEACWRDNFYGSCKITKGWSNEIICRYVSNSSNIALWDTDRWEIGCYRPALLMKLRKK